MINGKIYQKTKLRNGVLQQINNSQYLMISMIKSKVKLMKKHLNFYPKRFQKSRKLVILNISFRILLSPFKINNHRFSWKWEK